MRSIRAKITFGIMGCALIIAVLIGLISISESSKLIQKEAEDKLLTMAESAANSLNVSIASTEEGVNSMAYAAKAIFDINQLSNPEYLKNYNFKVNAIVKEFAANAPNSMDAYIILNPDITGELLENVYVLQDGAPVQASLLKKEDLIPSNPALGWYYNPIEAEKGVWSQPYVDQSLNVKMITYSLPIYANSTLIGVAGMDIHFDVFQKLVTTIKAYKTGYAFLVDTNLDVLVHKQWVNNENLLTVENGSLRKLAETMQQKKSDVLEYELNGEKKILSFVHLINDRIICIAAPETEILQGITTVEKIIAGLIILGIIIALIIAIYVSTRITKPILQVTTLVDKTAHLDLAQDTSYDTLLQNKDETGIIAKAVTEMREALRAIIHTVDLDAQQVLAHAQNLAAATNETAAATEEVASTVQELASNSSIQAGKAQESSDKLAILSADIDTMAQSSKLMKQYASDARSLNQHGIVAVGSLKEKFKANTDITMQVGDSVNTLANKSGSVNQIVDTIQSIATQTNLLALNAAIEAARAGEAGRGFAVVAEEIRKLAEQTSRSTGEIGDIVKEIEADITAAQSKMDDAGEIVNEANNEIEVTLKSFETISEAISKTLEQIDQLAYGIDNIKHSKDEIVTNMLEISSISQEAASSTQEISASIEEESSTLEDISNAADNLKLIVEELNSVLKQFKV